MVKGIKVNGEEPKQRTVEELSIPELKALAFDISEQVKNLQRQYNFVYESLAKKTQMENKQ